MNRKRSEGTSVETLDGWSETVQSVPIHLVSAGKYQPRQEFDQRLWTSWQNPLDSRPLASRGPPGAIGYEFDWENDGSEPARSWVGK